MIAWERGTASPNAAFLAKVAALGVDVQYVITGSRDYTPPPPLSAEEQTVIGYWREASPETRRAALGALIGARPGASPRQVFHGAVGNVVHGNAQDFTVRMKKKP